ncbi:MAG: CdaR family protein [Saprospiraceae bacterium]
MSKRNVNFNILQIVKDKSERAILMVCIGIAFVFWIATKMSKSYETDIEISVEFTPPSENNILTKTPPNKLDVSLKATGWDLMFQSLKRNEPILNYNLSNDTLQEFRLQQLTRDIKNKLTPDIQISTITPEYIPLRLDERVQKRIPIRINSSISVASQYLQTAPISVRPDTILVKGPASVLRKINQWQTAPLAFDQLNTRQTDDIPLRSYPNGQVIFEPQAVTYDIIIEQLTERIIEIPITLTGQQQDSIHIYPNTVKARCTMGLSNYERLSSKQFKIVASIADLTVDKLPLIIKNEPPFTQNITYSVDSVNYLIIKTR